MKPAKKTNGIKAEVVISCPHSDVCAAPARQAELMASLDEFSKSVGMMLERQETLEARVMAVLGRHAELAETVTVWKQREEEWLRTLSNVEAGLRRLEGENA